MPSCLRAKVTDPIVAGLGRRARGSGKPENLSKHADLFPGLEIEAQKTYHYLYADFLNDEGNRFFYLRGFLVKKGKAVRGRCRRLLL